MTSNTLAERVKRWLARLAKPARCFNGSVVCTPKVLCRECAQERWL
jgi:hypothetical protein